MFDFRAILFTALITVGFMTQSHAVPLTENLADLDKTESSIFLVQPTKSVGAVLIAHGLNLRPSKMNALASFFFDRGYDVYRLTLSGHDGDMESFKKVSAEIWMSEVVEAEKTIRARGADKPVLLLGYSLGALASLAVYDQGLVAFDKMILLAPPIQVTKTAALVRNLFGFPGMMLPSKNHPDYRVFSKTPVAAYKALFDLTGWIKTGPSPALRDSKAIVFFSPHDELVDLDKSRTIIEKNHSSWTVNSLDKDGATLKPVSHHLMIDEPSLGPSSFRHLLESISEFIAVQ